MNNDDLDGLGPACPACGCASTRVMGVRSHKGQTARSRECEQCKERFTTIEVFASREGIVTILSKLTAVVTWLMQR
jgi:transcriptional regulator NrdR family protein